MNYHFGKRLLKVRHKLGLNQRQMAKLLEIAPQYLGTIEKGKNLLSVEKIILFAERTHVSTDYLLFGKSNILDDIFLLDIDNLTPKEVECYIKIVNSIGAIIKRRRTRNRRKKPKVEKPCTNINNLSISNF